MDAFRVVTEESAGQFERKCNELASQGYKMQTCFCGYLNPNVEPEWTPHGLWLAVFALPEFVQQPRAVDTVLMKTIKKKLTKK